MSESMSYIKVNDIFDELTNENKKLSQCLNVLIKFKSFIDLVSNKLRDNLETDFIERFDFIVKEVEDVFRINEMKFSEDRESNKTKDSIENIGFESKHSKSNDKDYKPEVKIQKTRELGTNKIEINGYEIEYRLDADKKYICPHIGCDSRLKKRYCLVNHYKLHLGIPKPFNCDVDGCGYGTNKESELIDHKNIHNGLKPYKCEFCEKTTSSKKLMQSHFNYMHNILDQLIVCEFNGCQKQFKTQHSYKDHLKYRHLPDNYFVCKEPNCAFKTNTVRKLRRHKNSVHCEFSSVRRFVCTVANCSKSYKYIGELRVHMTTHDSELQFKCRFEGCVKRFKTAEDLETHFKVHPDRKFGCDWPGCEFITKSSKSYKVHRLSHGSRPQFVCDWPECGKRFTTKQWLQNHLRIHNNDKPYACIWPGCQYRTTKCSRIAGHQKIHLKVNKNVNSLDQIKQKDNN